MVYLFILIERIPDGKIFIFNCLRIWISKLSKVCPELSKFSYAFDLAKFAKNIKYFWVIHEDSAKFVEQLKKSHSQPPQEDLSS